jgi:hypothetical protein
MTAWETFYETIILVFLCVLCGKCFFRINSSQKNPPEDDFPRGIFIMLHSPAGI